MKQYYHSGLKEIAIRSGFKGSTLTSMESCSNFRHTHRFLVQEWEAIYKIMIAAAEIPGSELISNMRKVSKSISNYTVADILNEYSFIMSCIKEKSESNELL